MLLLVMVMVVLLLQLLVLLVVVVAVVVVVLLLLLPCGTGSAGGAAGADGGEGPWVAKATSVNNTFPFALLFCYSVGPAVLQQFRHASTRSYRPGIVLRACCCSQFFLLGPIA